MAAGSRPPWQQTRWVAPTRPVWGDPARPRLGGGGGGGGHVDGSLFGGGRAGVRGRVAGEGGAAARGAGRGGLNPGRTWGPVHGETPSTVAVGAPSRPGVGG